MIRRPPRSTPFPTRRSSDLVEALRQHLGPARRIAIALDVPLLFMKRVKLPPLGEPEKRNILRLEPERRSEEHTSELQSQSNLVCRLLLEKKNSMITRGPVTD